MAKLFLFIILTFIGIDSNAQDSIYLKNELIVAKVTEIGEDAVKYIYANESVINSLSKNLVKRIVFSSGRVQEFTRFSSFKEVSSWADWDNVSITSLEYEIRGLYRLDEVTSKARGATSISNVNRVKDRAYKKLKVETAMQGGSIVYISNEDVEGNRFSGKSSSNAETTITGVAYAESTVSLNEVTLFLSKYSRVTHTETLSQGNNLVEPVLTSGSGVLSYTYPTEDGPFVFITTLIPEFENLKMRIVYIDNDKINLMYKDKTKLYNFIISGIE